MRKPKKQSDSYNLRPILLLGIFVFSLFFVSLIYRLTGIIKNSKFDGQNRFTVIVFTQDYSKSIKGISFFSVDPQTKKTSLLTLKNVPKSSIDTFPLGIPIDGIIKSQKKIDGKNLNNFLIQQLFDAKSTNLTSIDILQLFIHSSLSKKSSQLVEISWPFDERKKNMTEDLFLDQRILKENLSIQIINATDESGVGNLFARTVINLGGNVVSVITSETNISKSEISFIGERMYTHGKLEKMFKYHMVERKKGGIADIIIVLGNDYKKIFN